MKSQDKIPIQTPPELEHLLMAHLENGEKNARISHEMEANLIQHQDKVHKLDSLIAENQLEKLNDIHETLKPTTRVTSFIQHFLDEVKGEKGDKGDAGYTPQKGQDYLTSEELAQIKAEATPRKGEHYFTPQEIEAFKQEVTPVKGVHYNDGLPGINGQNGKDGLNGKDGEDGDDADEVDIESVVQQVLSKLPKPEKVDHNAIIKKVKSSLKYSDIKDAPEFKMAGTGYLREITDVNVTGLVDGQTLIWQAKTNKWIPGTASGGTGGYTVETPTGTVDGNNTTFTVTVVPVYIVSDGTTYFNNAGFTISGLTVTMTVAPTSYIRSFHS